MPGVTKEQIARAKKWDLLSYLQAYEPQELKRCGKEYRTVSHDSLKISNGKWHWHSRGIGGRTALDYLVKVRHMGFVEAVEALSGGMVYTAREKAGPEVPVSDRAARRQDPSGSLILPEADRYGAAMVSYLQRRGIDARIISRCIGMGILYESRKYHNCVFVGRDRAGSPRYACGAQTANIKGRRGEATSGMASSCRPRTGSAFPCRWRKAPLMPFPLRPFGRCGESAERGRHTCPWVGRLPPPCSSFWRTIRLSPAWNSAWTMTVPDSPAWKGSVRKSGNLRCFPGESWKLRIVRHRHPAARIIMIF